MNKHDFAMTWKNNVRLARKIFAMQAETKTEPMDDAADKDLGSRILASDPGHYRTAFGPIENVSHLPEPLVL